MDSIPHTRRVLGNRALEMTEPHPFDHAAIISAMREDGAEVIAELTDALTDLVERYRLLSEAARLHPDVFQRNTAKAFVAIAKAKGEVA